ncbi:MAG TPA: ferritin-like domain-containing protein [Polyangiaceae bacterium]
MRVSATGSLSRETGEGLVLRGETPRAPRVHPSRIDRLLYPVHWLVWSDAQRRACKLLRFAETEADGGRDLARAAELTRDGLLRRLYLRHAMDEQRHADLFRARARAMLLTLPSSTAAVVEANWFAPGERGLDDLDVEGENDGELLAFLHLSERAAAERFAIYERVVSSDPATQRVFAEILRDEAFHMNYTEAQLKRVCPDRYRFRLLLARLSRLGKGYLRLAVALAGLIGTLVLLVQYFLVLPLFALLAMRAHRRERLGWIEHRVARGSLTGQYG